MTKVFKTAAIALMVLMSATATFAQTGDVDNSPTALVKLDVTVLVPPAVQVTTFEVTITWHFYSTTNVITETVTVYYDGTNPFKFPQSFSSNGDPSYVEYKINAKNSNGQIVLKTCGTFDIIIGDSNDLIISSWNNCPFEPWVIEKANPANTY